MSKPITVARLTELKSTTATCPPIDGFPAEYLKAFAPPSEDSACLACGKRDTFTWGILHGEGYCYECGWPARLYHFIKGDDGKETRIVRLLQYHPEGISLRSNTA